MLAISSLLLVAEVRGRSYTATCANMPSPVYQNGYVISRDRESSGITLYPKDGGKLCVEVSVP